MKGVFLDLDSVHPADLDLSQLQGALKSLECHKATAPDQVASRIADADIIISNKVLIEEQHIANAKCLKLICVAATGYNNIDIHAAKKHGIQVANARGYATESVVEHVFTLILALSRKLVQHQQASRNGEWENSPYFCVLNYPMLELSSLKLGVIGYGELGNGVAEKARQFGMQVLIAQSLTGEKRADRVALDVLLAESDIVTLHCPLSQESQNLIGENELGRMKESSFLINTARGGIVDESALARALRDGEIAGAGIDVLCREPPHTSDPLLAEDIPNLILTPHIAWAGRNARQRLLQEIAFNITAFSDGKSRNRVA